VLQVVDEIHNSMFKSMKLRINEFTAVSTPDHYGLLEFVRNKLTYSEVDFVAKYPTNSAGCKHHMASFHARQIYRYARICGQCRPKEEPWLQSSYESNCGFKNCNNSQRSADSVFSKRKVSPAEYSSIVDDGTRVSLTILRAIHELQIGRSATA